MTGIETAKTVRINGLSPEGVSPLFVDLDVRSAAKVSGSFVISDVQGLGLTRSRTHGGAFEVFRLERHIQGDAAHAFYACIPMRGAVTLTQHGRTCRLMRGDIGLMDSRAEYGLFMPESLDALWVRIAPEVLETRLSTTSSFLAHRFDGSQGIGLIASRFILSVASQAEMLANQCVTPVASMMMDLLCAAAANDRSGKALLPRTGMRTLERAKSFIGLHLGEEDLNPAQIAAGVGISTRYLADLFAAEQTTTMAWVMRRRLELTKAALTSVSWTPGVISNVAYRHGFKNVASFNRAFRNTFGTNPRHFMPDAVPNQTAA